MTSSEDTITSGEAKELLDEKYILILGDSVVRGLYKDFVKLYNADALISEDELRMKGEPCFAGDRLLSGGVYKGLTNGLDYTEVREYTASGRVRIRFYFLTKCYSRYMREVVLNDIKNQARKPDIVIMNSCLWDVSRYGVHAMQVYQRNIDFVMTSLRRLVPNALFLWLSALPVSNSSKGGAIVPSAEYIRPILPGLIRDGNYHCSQMCALHDVLYIDIHTLFSTMLHLRQRDGIHWNAIGNRLMSEITLHHIKAYFHGVQDFVSPSLRDELETKISTVNKRKRVHPFRRTTTNLLDSDLESISDGSLNNFVLSKHKRKRTEDDDKENFSQHRKMFMHTATSANQPRTMASSQPNQAFTTHRADLSTNRTEKFDHNFCDVLFDNEYEGLNLFHYSSHDIEEADYAEELSRLTQPSLIAPKHTHESNSPMITTSSPLHIECGSLPDRILEPLGISLEPDYIVLSSDEECEPEPDTYSSPLPIYLLNRLP